MCFTNEIVVRFFSRKLAPSISAFINAISEQICKKVFMFSGHPAWLLCFAPPLQVSDDDFDLSNSGSNSRFVDGSAAASVAAAAAEMMDLNTPEIDLEGAINSVLAGGTSSNNSDSQFSHHHQATSSSQVWRNDAQYCVEDYNSVAMDLIHRYLSSLLEKYLCFYNTLHQAFFWTLPLRLEVTKPWVFPDLFHDEFIL